MTVAAVAPVAARAVAGRTAGAAAARSGAGKVIDVTPSSSRPIRNARPVAGRASDAATGAGLGNLLSPGKSSSSSSSSGRGKSSRRVLVAEFALCMVVLAFSPVTDKHRAEGPGAFMKRASSTMAVFFILGLISTAGRGASRAAAAFGALMTLVLMISQRSIFTVLATKFGPGVGEGTDEDEGQADENDDDDVAKGGKFGGPLGADGDSDDVPDTGSRPTTLTPLFPSGIGVGAGIR